VEKVEKLEPEKLKEPQPADQSKPVYNSQLEEFIDSSNSAFLLRTELELPLLSIVLLFWNI
jgi:hypothetical protein